jgi:hypothetical protein
MFGECASIGTLIASLVGIGRQDAKLTLVGGSNSSLESFLT